MNNNILPRPLENLVSKLDSIVQSNRDIIALVAVGIFTNLVYGSRVFSSYNRIDANRTNGDLLIIYIGLFFASGGGKSGTYHTVCKYLLDWLDIDLQKQQRQIDEVRENLQIELKSLGNSATDRVKKEEILTELKELKNVKDVIIDDATSEGLIEALKLGGSPSIFIDNAGKYLKMASKSEHREATLRLIDNLYDSGKTRDKKIKSSNGRADAIQVDGLSVIYASTIGNSNLTIRDIQYGIEDGSLNKVLIGIQATAKDIPIETELSLDDAKDIEAFAKSMYKHFSYKNYYLSDEANTLYLAFHQRISSDYKSYYNAQDSISGYVIRMLKQSKRIAAVFQALESNLDYITASEEVEISQNIAITEDNMDKAIKFVEHYFKNHFMILLRHYGLLSKEDKVEKVYQFLLKQNNVGTTKRKITQYTKIRIADGLDSILDEMARNEQIGKDENGLYRILNFNTHTGDTHE